MKVGILGLGTVGGGVVNVLQKNSESIKRRTGVEIELVIAGVRDITKKRICDTKKIQLTEDPFEVVNHPDIDVSLSLLVALGLQRSLLNRLSIMVNISLRPIKHS